MDLPANVALFVSIVTGNTVRNMKGEDLGQIDEAMIDLDSGRTGYAVVASGSSIGMGDTLHAIPWDPATVELEQRKFAVDGNAESLEGTSGYDRDNWPRMADRNWSEIIQRYYGSKSYWDATVPAGEPF